MGIQAPAGPDAPPMHRQCDLLLGPLERLAILSMGACHLQVRGSVGWKQGCGLSRKDVGLGCLNCVHTLTKGKQ